jgi:pimeloyl-ACP methyl ester carboxylesterase
MRVRFHPAAVSLLLVLPAILVSAAGAFTEIASASGNALPKQLSGKTVSTLDGEVQPLFYWAPEGATERPTPLFVFLHSWSSDYRQDNTKWFAQAVKRGWIYVHPDFRGVNDKPAACGSRLARQDVLDSIDFICRKYRVDPQRIYLAGVSGGGHMSMLMAGHHPDRFSAVSAWVGIGNLSDWYRFHVRNGKPEKYARMIQQSLGGVPGESAAADAEARDRSPVFHLASAVELPTSIYAGVEDGHSGSVPVRHSLEAFNVIAAARGSAIVSEEEMQQLWKNRRLTRPLASDLEEAPEIGRDIFLRRHAGNAHVTIFDGGHESLPEPACEWLATQSRKATVNAEPQN